MKSLDDAWTWYTACKDGMKRLSHIAKFWDDIPWDGGAAWVGKLAHDNTLRDLQSDDFRDEAELVSQELDDLAVLVLFSVFEAIVRDIVTAQVRPEIEGLRHATLRKAGESVLDDIDAGSFYRVLEPFKADRNHDLVEHVNQVRRYRNWVAHGGRPDMKPGVMVRPKDAYERLRAFLDTVVGSPLLLPEPIEEEDEIL